jgi:hypothetical protein
MVGGLLDRFAVPFTRLGLPYMITGGAAAIVYGEPRLTNDLDLVVAMSPADAGRVAEALAAEDTYVPPVEVLETEAARALHGHFNVIHAPTSLRADVYLAGDDPLHAWGLAHRRALQVDGHTVWIASPAYVILRKLQYAAQGGGDRHLRDIHHMLGREVVPIDRESIAQRVAELGLGAVWARVLHWRERR